MLFYCAAIRVWGIKRFYIDFYLLCMYHMSMDVSNDNFSRQQKTYAHSCQIAVDGASSKLSMQGEGDPDGPRGVLYTLVRCLRNELSQGRGEPGGLLAAITVAMTLSRQQYSVDELRYGWGPHGAQVRQEFSLEQRVDLSVDTSWKPVHWAYVVRPQEGERIDVFELDGMHVPGNDVSDLPGTKLHTVVQPTGREATPSEESFN